MKTEITENVAAPRLANNDLTNELLAEILTKMLHLQPNHRIHLVCQMVATISSRMLPGLRDELIDVLVDGVEEGALIYDAVMVKRAGLQ